MQLKLSLPANSVSASRNSHVIAKIPTLLHQTQVKNSVMSQSTKSLMSLPTRFVHEPLRLPKIQSHVGANPKWIKQSTHRPPIQQQPKFHQSLPMLSILPRALIQKNQFYASPNADLRETDFRDQQGVV